MGPPGFQGGDGVHHAREAVPAAGARDALRQAVREAVDLDGVEAHQPDVAQRGGQPPGVVELSAAVRRHGIAQIEQHAHGHARLHLEHLEEELFQAQVGAPVDGAQIVAVMEIAVVQKLLAGAGEARRVVAAHQAGERFLPVDGQAFQLLQKLPVQ